MKLSQAALQVIHQRFSLTVVPGTTSLTGMVMFTKQAQRRRNGYGIQESETPAVRAGQRDSERMQMELPAESAFEEPLEYRSFPASQLL